MLLLLCYAIHAVGYLCEAGLLFLLALFFFLSVTLSLCLHYYSKMQMNFHKILEVMSWHKEQSVRFWGDLDPGIFLHGHRHALSTFTRWRNWSVAASQRYMLSLSAV